MHSGKSVSIVSLILVFSILLSSTIVTATLQDSLSELKDKVSEYEAGTISYLQLQVYTVEVRNDMNKELGLNAYTLERTTGENGETGETDDILEENITEFDFPNYLDELEEHFEKVQSSFESGKEKDGIMHLTKAEEILRKNGKTKSADLIQKMISLAEKKEYTQFMKYTGELESTIQEEMRFPDKHEKGNESRKERFSKHFEGVSGEALKQVFGEPSRYTEWAWSANEEKSERVENKLAEGEKVKIVLQAHPNILTTEEGKTTFYWTNLEVRFKQKLSITPSEAITQLQSVQDMNELAGMSVSIEQQLNQYLQQNREQCRETMKELFPGVTSKDEEQIRKDATIAEKQEEQGKGVQIRFNANRCLNCENNWTKT